MSKVDFLSAYC